MIVRTINGMITPTALSMTKNRVRLADAERTYMYVDRRDEQYSYLLYSVLKHCAMLFERRQRSIEVKGTCKCRFFFFFSFSLLKSVVNRLFTSHD